MTHLIKELTWFCTEPCPVVASEETEPRCHKHGLPMQHRDLIKQRQMNGGK